MQINNMLKRYEAEATITATYLSDQLPMSNGTTLTPYKLWHDTNPEYRHLWLFGCAAYICIKKVELDDRKFGSHVVKCVFVCYNSSTHMWWVFYPLLRHIIYSRDVVFFENHLYYKADVEGNEGFDAESNSFLTPEYKYEGDPSNE